MATQKPKSEKSIQSKLTELNEIVSWFDGDEVDIDEAIKKYEQGQKLVEELQADLKSAKNKVEKIKLKFK